MGINIFWGYLFFSICGLFLRYLPQVLINPENTTSYTILYNLKPYHVDLYSIADTGIKCQDKFNQVFIDDESSMNFLYQIMYASILQTATDYLMELNKDLVSDVICVESYTVTKVP